MRGARRAVRGARPREADALRRVFHPAQRPASAFEALSWPAAARAPFPFAAAAREAAADAQFTVVLNTFKRPDLLRRALAHYATCPRVAAVRVVWSEPTPAPARGGGDDSALFPGPPGFVRYDAHPTTAINNRFAPLPGLTTAAVLSADDDMLPPCAALDDAFAAWRAAPAALVGFYPRLHVAAPRCGTRYVSAEPALAWHGRYSLVLTKLAFLHARYLALYSDAMPAPIRDYVAARRECEDIAMAFLVANATRQPAVFVAPPLRFWAGAKWDGAGRAGISSGGVKGHHAMRGRCVADFAAMYGGRVPLVTAPLRDNAARAPLPPLP